MIAKVEAATAQPTAALLGRLSAALGLTLSELIARTEGGRLARAGEQPEWTDPVSGYTRRALSPAGGRALQLTEVELPAGAEVAFPADAYTFIRQQIWVLDGRLDFKEGDMTHELATGDCLELGEPAPCTFANPSERPCRYLVVVAPYRAA